MSNDTLRAALAELREQIRNLPSRVHAPMAYGTDMARIESRIAEIDAALASPTAEPAFWFADDGGSMLALFRDKEEWETFCELQRPLESGPLYATPPTEPARAAEGPSPDALRRQFEGWLSKKYSGLDASDESDQFENAMFEAWSIVEAWSIGLHAALSTSTPAPQPAAPSEPEFCWLVELFQRGGNSMGRYHTGFTDLHNQSRSTANPNEAKRYGKDDAVRVAQELNLHTMACEWRAIEHGFGG